MLIVSKFRDFYDSMASQGVDKTLVYKRETKAGEFIELPRYGLSFVEEHKFNGTRIDVRLVGECEIIVFCGKVHMYWRGEVQINKGGTWATEQVFHRETYKKLVDVMRAAYKLPELKARTYRRNRFNKDRVNDRLNTFREALERVNWDELHARTKCPVFKVRETISEDRAELLKLPSPEWRSNNQWHRIVENPVLRESGFERYIDPFSAWQEITMYLGGVIGRPERPMYELNDVEKRDKAGFDNWSFKKQPEKIGQ